jgi:serine/threonine protein phosphatase PrpC
LFFFTFLRRGNRGYRISRDHKPLLPEEIERIQSNGGFVAMGRVNGSDVFYCYFFFLAILAVSRAFGDHAIKNLVISDPYIAENEIMEGFFSSDFCFKYFNR